MEPWATWHNNDRKTRKADYQHSPEKPKPGTTRDAMLYEQVAVMLKQSYPDNVNTNAFCAAVRSLQFTS